MAEIRRQHMGAKERAVTQDGSPPGWTSSTSGLVAEAIAEFLEYDVSHFIKVTKVEEYKETSPDLSTSYMRAHPVASVLERTRRTLARQWCRVLPVNSTTLLF